MLVALSPPANGLFPLNNATATDDAERPATIKLINDAFELKNPTLEPSNCSKPKKQKSNANAQCRFTEASMQVIAKISKTIPESTASMIEYPI